MNRSDDVLAAERCFFTALLEADADALNALLTEDFLLIDVMAGSVIPGAALIEAVGVRQLIFEEIEPKEANVRFYGTTAIVVGRTQMRGRFGETPFTTRSRYTHVFVEQQGQWKFASAQGTQILGE